MYLIEILHQTTTIDVVLNSSDPLYLIEILHQTTTKTGLLNVFVLLYLIEILHQTTTLFFNPPVSLGCILLKFYIKPQQTTLATSKVAVVSY